MFLAGHSPAVTLSNAELPHLLQRLEAVGYRQHSGPRIVRTREIAAYLRPLERGERQIHVQIVKRRDGRGFDAFGHTEPWGWGFRHLWAALTDRVSYQHGARILREDLGADWNREERAA